ncbi:MAG: hypothetical protein R3B83_05960 [Nitrospirales bacterium]|nr:hypothetical protein [Nitrospirales bacterium]
MVRIGGRHHEPAEYCRVFLRQPGSYQGQRQVVARLRQSQTGHSLAEAGKWVMARVTGWPLPVAAPGQSEHPSLRTID